VEVKKRDVVDAPRSFADYEIVFSRDRLPKGVKAGFIVTGADGRVAVHWDEPPKEAAHITLR